MGVCILLLSMSCKLHCGPAPFVRRGFLSIVSCYPILGQCVETLWSLSVTQRYCTVEYLTKLFTTYVFTCWAISVPFCAAPQVFVTGLRVWLCHWHLHHKRYKMFRVFLYQKKKKNSECPQPSAELWVLPPTPSDMLDSRASKRSILSLLISWSSFLLVSGCV